MKKDTDDPVRDLTLDCVVGELAEISLVLQAMLTAEQREWFNERKAERDAELRAVSGFHGNGRTR